MQVPERYVGVLPASALAFSSFRASRHTHTDVRTSHPPTPAARTHTHTSHLRTRTHTLAGRHVLVHVLPHAGEGRGGRGAGGAVAVACACACACARVFTRAFACI